jgi:hypothetical protein
LERLLLHPVRLRDQCCCTSVSQFTHRLHFAEKLGSGASSSSSKDNDPFGAFSIKK